MVRPAIVADAFRAAAGAGLSSHPNNSSTVVPNDRARASAIPTLGCM
jgi:hypothetical protein